MRRAVRGHQRGGFGLYSGRDRDRCPTKGCRGLGDRMGRNDGATGGGPATARCCARAHRVTTKPSLPHTQYHRDFARSLMISVLHLTSSFGLGGGAETNLLRLVCHMDQSRFCNTVVTMTDGISYDFLQL